MSERIQDLAEQSGMTQYVAAHNKSLERFADLIIQECRNWAAINGGLSSDLDLADVREHFGIEAK